jgi:hypothetical protein
VFYGCGPPSAQAIGKYVCTGARLLSGYPHMGARRGDKGAHDMHAYLLHSRVWVRDCVVDMHAMMHACVRDRGTWRHPCRVSRSAHMCLWDG